LYVAKAADINIDRHDEMLKWWKENAINLPKWSPAAQKVFLFIICCFRALFSCLKACIKDQQDLPLQDYIQALLMLQYNGH